MSEHDDEATEPTPRTETSRASREAEILAARRESLTRLADAGMDPFALTLETRSASPNPIPSRASFASSATSRPAPRAMPAGRSPDASCSARDMGKLKFLVVRDRTGDIQLFCSAKGMDPAAFALLDEADLGDIVAATGPVGMTKKGELSIFVERWAMLTKSLRPLPEKWHGLKDPDLQQRRRYLHLATDDVPRRYFLARAAVLQTMRRVLDERGFVEFEGPMLQLVAGGANARPFTTFHHVLDQGDEAAHLARALPQADAGGWRRTRLRTRPQLPQRRHRPRPQPGVHDARGLPGLRRLRLDDGALRDPAPRERPCGEPDHGTPRGRPADQLPRSHARSRTGVPAHHDPGVGERGDR